MNTVQLQSLLFRHPATSNMFSGVYALDQLPFKRTKPFYVVNFDRQNEPGSHWVAIYFLPDGRAEYFDSFGFPPLLPEIVDFLDRNSYEWTHNNKQLQDAKTGVCGQYCFFYILLRSKGLSMQRIIHCFKTANRDRIVYQYLSKLLNTYVPFYNCV